MCLKDLEMEIGSIVKFKNGLYPDEKGVTYRLIEINGDRGLIVFIGKMPYPPQSVAKINELEVINPKEFNGKKNG